MTGSKTPLISIVDDDALARDGRLRLTYASAGAFGHVSDLTQKLLSPPSHLSLAECEGGHARRLAHIHGIRRSGVSAPVAGSNTAER